MFYELKSTRTIAEIAHQFAAIARDSDFGTLFTHDLHAKLNEKGVPFGPHCLIFEICDPHQARAVLTADSRLAAALPCRIAVHDIQGVVVISTLLPSAILPADASPALKQAAAEVEDRIKHIMRALQ